MPLPNSLKAQILRQYSHVIPGKIKITEHFFTVPLDYSKPSGENLRIFVRSAERYKKPVDPSKDENEKLPLFLFLQGGPGAPCPPVAAGGWQDFVMDKGYKVLMLDTRGNGLSTTLTTKLLQKRGGPEEQAGYLKHFRADNIVNDAEAIRLALTEEYPEEKKKWSVLGQSYGGFCIVHYLSKHPQGLKEVFTTGGIPPLVEQPDAVYAKLVQRAVERSGQYYEKFPEDVGRVHLIVDHLAKNKVVTPGDTHVLPETFQSLGMGLGFSGYAETLHALILRAGNDLAMFGELSSATLSDLDRCNPFHEYIIYAILHEPAYLQGAAANWSAERTLKAAANFSPTEVKAGDPINFTFEMVTRKTYHSSAALRPLLPAAEILAQDADWPDLYDEQQLAANEVPMYAATYYDDAYVDFDFAQETAKKIKGCKQFITNRLQHNGLRVEHKQVMERLFELRDDADL